jgi:hypothetical protein
VQRRDHRAPHGRVQPVDELPDRVVELEPALRAQL